MVIEDLKSKIIKIFKGLSEKIREKMLSCPLKKLKLKNTVSPSADSRRGKRFAVFVITRKHVVLFLALICAAFVLTIVVPGFFTKNSDKQSEADVKVADRLQQQDLLETEEEEGMEDEQESEKEPAIIDLSGNSVELEISMQRINEPTPCGKEILYSAGNAASLEGPVLTRLFLFNIDTGEEKEIARTKLKFGEIYEGRLNDDWVVWLDTDQVGTNYIYGLKRKSGEVITIKKCKFNKPQIRLSGDNVVWVEQKDEEQDRLYLYNFKSGEPVSLESFNDATYGTSPPAICDDIVVWVYPHPDDPDKSIIKRLDLRKALRFGQGDSDKKNELSDKEDASFVDVSEGGKTEKTDGAKEGQSDNAEENDEGFVEPDIIDPQGFAIYPATNGRVIAWLDNLDPSRANLKMTADGGRTIISVAHGVGRFFGVGDKFIVYTQDGVIMLYFWEIDRYARLTPPGEKGRLSQVCVSGNMVIWYDANDNKRKKDIIKMSVIEQPSI